MTGHKGVTEHEGVSGQLHASVSGDEGSQQATSRRRGRDHRPTRLTGNEPGPPEPESTDSPKLMAGIQRRVVRSDGEIPAKGRPEIPSDRRASRTERREAPRRTTEDGGRPLPLRFGWRGSKGGSVRLDDRSNRPRNYTSDRAASTHLVILDTKSEGTIGFQSTTALVIDNKC